jgi:5-formyltetrahydrofolate cyclo-ligase
VDEKNNVRQYFLTLRKQLDANMVDYASQLIKDQFLKEWDFKQQNISCFLPMTQKKEVNTFPLLQSLEKKNKLWVPVTDFQQGRMAHFSFDQKTPLKVNPYGIPEPVEPKNTIDAKALDVIVIPLLAADFGGNRIGYGKGFYDKLLKDCSSQAIRIGLSFFEPIENIPCEAFDEKLHFLVTPKQTYRF